MFETISDATKFLQAPQFDCSHETANLIYEITYTDGTEFECTLETIDDVKTLHHQIERPRDAHAVAETMSELGN